MGQINYALNEGLLPAGSEDGLSTVHLYVEDEPTYTTAFSQITALSSDEVK